MGQFRSHFRSFGVVLSQFRSPLRWSWLVLGCFASFWVSLGFVLGCFRLFLVVFGLIWLFSFSLFWVALARFRSFLGLVLVSFWVVLGCLGSFDLFGPVMGSFGSF